MREPEILQFMRRYDRDGDALFSIQEFEEMIVPYHAALDLRRS